RPDHGHHGLDAVVRCGVGRPLDRIFLVGRVPIWNRKQMIRLHGYAPLWGLSDLSPFVTKVEVYLRLAKLPYELVPFSPEMFACAPKGKYPCIVDGEETIPDSSFIIEHLKRKYGDPLDAKHAPAERAAGHAIKRMLEENFYWVIVAERWRDTKAAVEQ